MMVTKRTCGLPLICLVCGDTARGINFNLMSCMSCKTFFRRHGTKAQNHLRCLHKNNCEITLKTRGDCSACRLQKCLALGMDPKLIGKRFNHRIRSDPIQYIKTSPLSSSLFLLPTNHSTLTTNEWTLFSNMIQIYDTTNIFLHTKYLLEQQATLPPKIRSKSSTVFDIIKYFYSTFQLLIERIPYYQYFSLDIREKLIRFNSKIVGTLNSFFIMRETDAMNYPAFRNACLMIYDQKTMSDWNIFISRLESNGTLVKLLFYVLAFSTNCGVVTFDSIEKIHFKSNSILLFNIQNIFLTILWKYLIYQYDYIAAVRWYSFFTKYTLDLIRSVSEKLTTVHFDAVDTIIENTIDTFKSND